MEFTDIRAVVKSKCSFDLVDGDVFCNHTDVFVKGTAHEVEIGEYESLFGIEAESDDVFCVLEGEFLDIFDGKFFGMHEFLVVGEHDYEGTVECFLEETSEFEGGGVADVHAVAGGATAGVKVERFCTFVAVEHFVEISMRGDHSSSH